MPKISKRRMQSRKANQASVATQKHGRLIHNINIWKFIWKI